MTTRDLKSIRRIPAMTLGVAGSVVLAMVPGLVPAAASPAAPAAGPVQAVTVLTPAADQAVRPDTPVTLAVAVQGQPGSVTVSVGGHRRPLTHHGASWSTTVDASDLAAGRNTLTVSATGAAGAAVTAHRVLYRGARAASLGLRARVVDSGGRLGVAISSSASVTAVTMSLNDRDLTSRLRVGRLRQTVYLGGDEGLRPGANQVHLLATGADGTFQSVTVPLQVDQHAPVAAATTDPGSTTALASGAPVQAAPRVHTSQAITLDGTGSHAGAGASTLTYRWSIAQAPAGSTARIADADQARARFSPDRPGDYLFTLTVTDSRGRVASDSTPLLAVPPVAPVGEVLETQVPGGIYLGGTTYPRAAGQPMELLLINRDTLAATAYSGGSTAASVSALTGAITAANNDDGLVEVLSAPAGYQCTTVSGACPAFETLLQTLSVDDAKTPATNDVAIHAGKPFSTITITSSTDTSVWRSSVVPATTAPLLPGVAVRRGNLGGHLEWPNGSDLAYSAPVLFVPDTSLPFTTSYSSTPTSNIMRIGTCLTSTVLQPTPGLPPCQTFPSKNLTTCGTGPTGGFQVTVLWAATLALIANKTFTTNTGCGAGGFAGDAAAITSMLAFAQPYATSDGMHDYLVMVQSIGSPRPQTFNPAVTSAWTAFGTKAIVPLGGAGSTFDYLGYSSGYALVGYNSVALPGFGAPFGVEASSDAPHLPGHALPAALNGNLSRNQRNDYYPQSSGPLTGPASNGLATIVTRPASTWPQEDTPGKLRALAALTQIMITRNAITNWGQPATGNCWGLDHYSIRDIYCDLSRAGNLTVPSTYPNPAPGAGYYSPSDWKAVTGEIRTEQGLLSTVATTISTLTATLGTAGITESSIQTLVSNIQTALQRPTTTPVRSLWSFWLSMFSSIADVVGGFVGLGDGGLALAGAFLNTLSEGFNVSSQLVPSATGSSQNKLDQKVQGTATDIEDELPGYVLGAASNLIHLEPILFTDYNKLVLAANLLQTAQSISSYGYVVNRSLKAWATPLLISSAFRPDALVTSGQAVNSTHTYADGPYVGDANNFSCYYGDLDHGVQTFAPFPDTAAGGSYLAGSPAQRYVLATGENPSTNSTVPDERISPDQPPESVLDALFAPTQSANDLDDLGLTSAQVYERDLGLGSGITVTCPLSPGEPTGAIATSTSATGDENVFFTTVPVGSDTPSLSNDYVDPRSGVWHGPGPLPGTPDVPSVSQNGQQAAPLAAIATPGAQHLFFLQKGKLVNDYDLGTGWAGPAQLPGKPNGASSGGTLAAASSGDGDIHVFFWQGTNLVYDQLTGGGWIGPNLVQANATDSVDDSTQLAAVSLPGGGIALYYPQPVNGDSNANIVQITSQGSGWSAPTTVVSGADAATPIGATTDGNGHPVVLYTSGGTDSSTTLMSSTNTGTGWNAATIGPYQESVLPSVAAVSSVPNGIKAFVLPSNGWTDNQFASYTWDSVGGWTAGPPLPVPFIVGDFPY